MEDLHESKKLLSEAITKLIDAKEQAECVIDSDKDFIVKMQGLIHHARQAMIVLDGTIRLEDLKR